MTERLWVIDFVGSDVPSPATSPDLSDLEVVVADTHFVVVSATLNEVEAAIRGVPYWRNAGQPSAGKWMSAGGDVVYIDDGCNIVNDGEAVLRSLGYSDFQDADDLLESLRKCY